MKVNEFVEEFKIRKDKTSFCKEHIKTMYLPYELKISICSSIVKSTMYKEINGKNMFCVNSPIKYELMVLSMIKHYTDIELDPDDTLAGFNALIEANAVYYLCKTIGYDYQALEKVMDEMWNDEIQNNSLSAQMDTKLEAFGLVVNALIEAMSKEVKAS